MIFSLIITFLFGIQTTVSEKTELIDWSEKRKLTWTDFKGTPDPASPNAALTSSSINIDFEYDQQELKFYIRCRFNTVKSWGKVKTDYILAHEQGHFDIAELYARKMFKALKAYKYNPKTISDDINRIYQEIMTSHHQFQSAYDRETDHSRIPDKQAEWEKKINDELKALEAFKDYRKK